ncbi:unnamed protein product [Paramecium sonneborni]|uniref:Uncharacterized protein n=1 Tax=Paramecium sonneborni TaxID=65129 RepID=A0A8S1PJ37_9CILI|nr:unnamed protein product [Paramecium sonneborni]
MLFFKQHFYEKLNQQRDKQYKQIEIQFLEYLIKLSYLFKNIEEAQNQCIKILTFVKKEFSQFQYILDQTLNKTINIGENPTISQLQQLAQKIDHRQQNTYKDFINKLQDLFKEIRNVFNQLDNKQKSNK